MMLIAFSAVVFSYVEPARDATWTTRVTVPSVGGAVTFKVNVVRLPVVVVGLKAGGPVIVPKMGPWAAAGARTRAKTAARIPRAIGPDFRVVHRLRRERNSPTPTAAIAPTMTAMSGRFSGGDGVMSGPLTVAPGDARTGS